VYDFLFVFPIHSFLITPVFSISMVWWVLAIIFLFQGGLLPLELKSISFCQDNVDSAFITPVRNFSFEHFIAIIIK